jgi:hypothetical protein
VAAHRQNGKFAIPRIPTPGAASTSPTEPVLVATAHRRDGQCSSAGADCCCEVAVPTSARRLVLAAPSEAAGPDPSAPGPTPLAGRLVRLAAPRPLCPQELPDRAVTQCATLSAVVRSPPTSLRFVRSLLVAGKSGRQEDGGDPEPTLAPCPVCGAAITRAPSKRSDIVGVWHRGMRGSSEEAGVHGACWSVNRLDHNLCAQFLPDLPNIVSVSGHCPFQTLGDFARPTRI